MFNLVESVNRVPRLLVLSTVPVARTRIDCSVKKSIAYYVGIISYILYRSCILGSEYKLTTTIRMNLLRGANLMTS